MPENNENNKNNKRIYRSDVRRRQADETRSRIVDAAEALIGESGYAAVTIDAVARRAAVSPQSVYAVFGSKAGLFDAVVDRARFDAGYQQLLEAVQSQPDAVARLRYAAAIARRIYDAERSVIEWMGGAAAVSSELAEKMRSRETDRRNAQHRLIIGLIEQNRLKPGLDETTASDILWTLTGRDLYRMLVQDCGWTADRYQSWLAETITTALAATADRADSLDNPDRLDGG